MSAKEKCQILNIYFKKRSTQYLVLYHNKKKDSALHIHNNFCNFKLSYTNPKKKQFVKKYGKYINI